MLTVTPLGVARKILTFRGGYSDQESVKEKSLDISAVEQGDIGTASVRYPDRPNLRLTRGLGKSGSCAVRPAMRSKHWSRTISMPMAFSATLKEY